MKILSKTGPFGFWWSSIPTKFSTAWFNVKTCPKCKKNKSKLILVRRKSTRLERKTGKSKQDKGRAFYFIYFLLFFFVYRFMHSMTLWGKTNKQVNDTTE